MQNQQQTSYAKRLITGPDGSRLTQKQIAEMLGIPQSTADKMMRGETRMPIHTLVALWRLYDVGPELAVEWARILTARHELRHPGEGDE
mgnify:CR=1 FL=1